ncbi:hypothetical protein Xbud_01973 [Xenorhabdus budapestensis]|uniref:Uncharacterized protein n=1 Tax=Xenorhabdus budapestensis TaxID=290110 RepID=A0A2D0J0Y7_XENBU|nr:hypothetical protein Xbud_01973 [Xenorhabdus budapestensis]
MNLMLGENTILSLIICVIHLWIRLFTLRARAVGLGYQDCHRECIRFSDY